MQVEFNRVGDKVFASASAASEFEGIPMEYFTMVRIPVRDLLATFFQGEDTERFPIVTIDEDSMSLRFLDFHHKAPELHAALEKSLETSGTHTVQLPGPVSLELLPDEDETISYRLRGPGFVDGLAGVVYPFDLPMGFGRGDTFFLFANGENQVKVEYFDAEDQPWMDSLRISFADVTRPEDSTSLQIVGRNNIEKFANWWRKS